MTQFSGLWTTGGAGDGASTYTRANLTEFFKVLAACLDEEGVAAAYLSALACSANGANTLRTAAGGALVDGKAYYNDANVDTNIPSAVGGGNTRIDRIVLRADWTAQTVRITRIAGTDAGSPTAPAITQTPGTTYDIKLCQVLVDTSGAVTVTDERVFAQVGASNGLADSIVSTAKLADAAVTASKLAAAVAGSGLAGGAGTALSVNVDGVGIEISSDTLQLKDGGVTAAKIANRSRKLVVPCSAGYNTTDGAAVIAQAYYGILCADNKNVVCAAAFEVPQDYSSAMTVKAMLPAASDVGDGNVYTKLEIFKATTTMSQTAAWSTAFAAVAVQGEAGNNDYNEIMSTALTGVAAGDKLMCVFTRNGAHASDTLSTAIGFMGFRVEYTADS